MAGYSWFSVEVCWNLSIYWYTITCWDLFSVTLSFANRIRSSPWSNSLREMWDLVVVSAALSERKVACLVPDDQRLFTLWAHEGGVVHRQTQHPLTHVKRQPPNSTVGCRRTVCRRTARLEFHLRTVSPHAKSVCCEDDFFGGIADFEMFPLRRFETFQPHSPPGMRRHNTVCALQANLRDSKTDWKIRTRLAGVVKNKSDPGWNRLPPVLWHPTVL